MREQRVVVEPVEPAIGFAADADHATQILLDGRKLVIP